MNIQVNASKNNHFFMIMIFLTMVGSFICGFVTYNYNDLKYWDNYIYPGVTIEGIDLSGKTRQEASTILKNLYSEQVQKKKINISAGDKNYVLSYSKLNLKYNIDETIEAAYFYGKQLNLFSRYFLIKNPKIKNYTLKVTYDKTILDNLINTIGKDISKNYIDATLEIGSGVIDIVPEVNGRTLDKDKLGKDLVFSIDTKLSGNINLKASVKVVSPRIKKEMLSSINGRIGTFSTSFGSISSPQRANNIIIATRSINGKILMPGDIFSFNDVVGERTEDKGYESAPVIIGNKLESGLGGGICQVSTTLYNSILDASLKPLEITHHTLPVHYVQGGMDATVDYGNIDFKFKNTLASPIYIQAYTAGGNVVFNLYSSINRIN
ncbi:VanW family protein [Clostridium sp. DJ247]|uniref:VanW family protein n=1 Tax=Clostridium sp. DJ247 TaxID=2726188 RepID=UPI00162766F8|nr:VanW family protein [Clostridium sp. DJ247]MBC2581509.1 hypothetical protein [Clostridium sp. DJ247]